MNEPKDGPPASSLAGISLADSTDTDAFVAAFQGDDRLVVDYLTEEFLTGLRPDDRHRLLQTSILERLSGPLIDAVCDTSDGARWLGRMATTNQLLIGLDRTGTWYRYHHLLADLLRVEAENSIQTELAHLHRRAGAWHRHHGTTLTAVEHYLQSGDHAEAADLIWDDATELLNSGQLATLQRQIARLGPLADHHVGTATVNGYIALFTRRLGDARHYLDLARTLEPNENQTRLTIALAIYIAIASGDVATALEEAKASEHPTESAQTLSLIWARTWGGDFDAAAALLPVAERLADQEHNDARRWQRPDLRGHHRHRERAHRGRPPGCSSGPSRSQRQTDWPTAPTSPWPTASWAEPATTPTQRSRQRHEAWNCQTSRPLSSVGAMRSPQPPTFFPATDTPTARSSSAKPALLIDRCPDPGIIGQYLARVEARQGLLAPTPTSAALIEGLTDREQAVLHYLPSQLTQREIANELYISLNTVRTHCKSIFRKLGVGDRKAAVQAARDNDLL